MSKVLLSKDLNKIMDIKLKKIKNLINSFQILMKVIEIINMKLNLKYFIMILKLKNLLGKKNISFSEPKKISAIFSSIAF